MRLIFDFGNARGKWYNPRNDLYEDFLHALAPLTESEWQTVVGRGKPPKGLLRVNGLAYAVGDAARRHQIREKPRGAARYNELYYGPAACFAMAEAFKTSQSVSLYASHAPQDHRYALDLAHSVKGAWAVECQYGTLTFEVTRVSTFDEPLGGYAHYAFSKRGEERADNPIADKTTLVIDVGGYTTDRAAIDAGGEIDQLSIASVRAGTIAVIEQFERDLRDHNRGLFKETGDLDIRRVEQAIIEGHYRFGKIDIDCRDEAREAIASLVADVCEVINAAGGAANFDAVLLTGGGSALIYEALCEAMPNIDFIMVEADRSLMKFANVFGGAKIATLMSKVGAV